MSLIIALILKPAALAGVLYAASPVIHAVKNMRDSRLKCALLKTLY